MRGGGPGDAAPSSRGCAGYPCPSQGWNWRSCKVPSNPNHATKCQSKPCRILRSCSFNVTRSWVCLYGLEVSDLGARAGWGGWDRAASPELLPGAAAPAPERPLVPDVALVTGPSLWSPPSAAGTRPVCLCPRLPSQFALGRSWCPLVIEVCSRFTQCCYIS